MEKEFGDVGIYTQQSKTCRPTKDIIRNHPGRIIIRNMKTNYHKNMAPKREGPFKIKEVLGLVTY
jgi:hypothetical protein